jgi:hypothetical protein
MDIERTMEFVLEQQAQFSVNLANLTGVVNRLMGGVENVVQTVQGLASSVEQLRSNSAESHRRFEQVRDRHEAEIAALRRQQIEFERRTDERLDALIRIVDGMIRGDESKN